MLWRETICPVCRGQGFIGRSSECAVWCTPCVNCQNGIIVVPVKNGDLIRQCTNEQLVRVYEGLKSCALYSGGDNSRLLDSSAEDFKLWLNKATDEVDLRTIFDFVNEKDYEHPWTKVVTTL